MAVDARAPRNAPHHELAHATTPGTLKSRPRNGDVNGCWARVRLTSIAYGGENIGPISSWAGSTAARPATARTPSNIAHGGSFPANVTLLDGFFGLCGRTVSLEVVLDAQFAGNMQQDARRNITFACDNKTVTRTVQLSVLSNGKTATVTFTFEVTPSGCP